MATMLVRMRQVMALVIILVSWHVSRLRSQRVATG